MSRERVHDGEPEEDQKETGTGSEGAAMTSSLSVEQAVRFWEAGEGLESLSVRVGPPERPLELLEMLGPSPFERGGFPVVGFLATTYEKVSRFALDRG